MTHGSSNSATCLPNSAGCVDEVCHVLHSWHIQYIHTSTGNWLRAVPRLVAMVAGFQLSPVTGFQSMLAEDLFFFWFFVTNEL